MEGDSYAFVMKDHFAGWLECYPRGSKCSEDATAAMHSSLGPKENIGISTPMTHQSSLPLRNSYDCATQQRRQAASKPTA